MVNRVVARTQLTDLNDSSALKQILAATARELDDIYFQMTRLTDLFDLAKAKGDDLDLRAREIVPGTLTRAGARQSVGRVVFSRATNTGSTITIPVGTSVKTADNKVFTTVEEATITSSSAEVVPGHGTGRDSSEVVAVSSAAGASMNIDAGEIVAFVNKPPGLAAVVSTTAFVQGRDRESDEDFVARIRDYVATLARSTVQTLEQSVIDAQDAATGRRIVFSAAVEDVVNRGNVTLYIDDGAGTAAATATGTLVTLIDTALGGEEHARLDAAYTPMAYPESGISLYLTRPPSGAALVPQANNWYVDPTSGLFYLPMADYAGVQANDNIEVTFTYYTGLIREAQRIIDGVASDRANYPGMRAAGVRVRVRTPTVRVVPVVGVVSSLPTADHDAVLEAATSAVTRYINTLGIGGVVVLSELIEQIMRVPGVYDVTLSLPTENVVPSQDEIPRSNAADVSLT